MHGPLNVRFIQLTYILSYTFFYPGSGHFSIVRQLNTVGFYPPKPSYIPDPSKCKAVETKYVTKIEVQTVRSLYIYIYIYIYIYEINLSLYLCSLPFRLTMGVETEFHAFLFLTRCHCDPTSRTRKGCEERRAGSIVKPSLSHPTSLINLDSPVKSDPYDLCLNVASLSLRVCSVT